MCLVLAVTGLVCFVVGVARVSALEVARNKETELSVVSPLGNIRVCHLSVEPVQMCTRRNPIDLELGCVFVGWISNCHKVLGSWLQNEITLNWNLRAAIGKCNLLPTERSLATRYKFQMQGWRFTAVDDHDTGRGRFARFDHKVRDCDCSNPSALLISKRVLGASERFIKTFLRLGETILRDFLLRGDGVKIIQFGLLPSLLHFRELPAHHAKLFACDNGIPNRSEHGGDFYHCFPPWRLIGTAMLSFFLGCLGWGKLRTGHAGWWMLIFLSGITLWGYSINWWLNWSLGI